MSVPPEVIKKMVEDAIAVQRADIGVIKEKRGTKFTIPDALPYVEAVRKMAPVGPMKKEVIDLHVNSVVAHYEILNEIAKDKTIRPEDDPFVEHYQTPVVLKILYELDPKFREAVETFVKELEKRRDLIGREAMRKYCGFYGPTCVVDFAYSVGGMSGLFAYILEKVPIDKKYKEAILAAKSWGMNTSYGFGAKFISAIEAGKTLEEALSAEIEMLKKIWLTPVEAQVEVMKEAGHISFDPAEYMKRYEQRIRPYVKAALDAGVHPGNICVVPAYCVGDVGHHIAQSMYNMAKDDVVMAIMEAVTEVMISTLETALKEGKLKSEYDVLRVATGSTAAAVAYIAEQDGFSASMIIDLLVKRFFNLVLKSPARGVAAELHNVDFMDMLLRGWKIITPKPWGRGGEVIKGVKVDLTPIEKNEVLKNPQRYTYPGCAITVRFSALMRLADFPCLLTSEPVTATLNTYIVALRPETVISPPPICKSCAPSFILTGRCIHCYYRRVIAKEVPLVSVFADGVLGGAGALG
ncbi:MAG: DUF2193 domain-containing protein [Thermoprotei archaeon]|nr:MAG: DUF2193 domain-containing protein [Thermoprotei archaeon]